MPKYYPLPPRRTIVEVEVPVGDGDRDVSYVDSFDLGDTLAGTLGPVQAQDSLDLADSFVADNFSLGDSFDASDALQAVRDLVAADSVDISDRLAGTLGPVQAIDSFDLADTFVADAAVLQDSIDVADALRPITDVAVRDSLDLSDRLAGTLGPVVAPDSFNLADTFVADEATLQDSIAISDAPSMPEIDAQAQDTIDFSDRLGPLYQVEDDSLHISDSLGQIDRLDADDSLSVSDQLRAISGPDFSDSLNLADAGEATLTFDIPDSLDFSDLMDLDETAFGDSVNVADAREVATVTTARLWPNTQISNSNFTTPENFADTSEASAAVLTIAQTSSLISGSSQNKTGTLIVSCADINFSPTPTISSATVIMGWSTTASGGLQSGNSVNVNLDYSLNDGSSWTTLATVTTVAGSGAPSASLGSLTYAQINQLRFRATGTVTSGTTAVLGGATQTFNALYARVQFNASQTL